MFRPAFSIPTYHRFLVLVLAAVLTTGRRTVTNVLRTARERAPGLGEPWSGLGNWTPTCVCRDQTGDHAVPMPGHLI
jgi:hypothetical protein